MSEKPRDLIEIFSRAVGIEGEEEREDFLRESCGEDEALLQEVRNLLQADGECDDSFTRPFSSIGQLSGEVGDLDEAEEELPRSFGDYMLEEQVGQGGMGVVYRAKQQALERTVALKMIRNSQLATRQEVLRFYAEARAAAGLQHPGIVPVLENGKMEGQHFFTMAFVDGPDLEEVVEQELLSLQQKLFILKRMTAAVSYAHKKGVIHRDLKPSNILLSRKEGAREAVDHYEPQVSDFGLAKQLDHDLELTFGGEVMGTPNYMSPEQAEGETAEITAVTDVYSLGAVMYFMFAGRRPFEKASAWEVMKLVKAGEVKSLGAVSPATPKELVVICHKCLETEPGRRYVSAADLLRDLENFEHHRPLLAKPASRVRRAVKFVRRHPAAAVMVGLVLLMIIGGTTASVLLKRSTEEKMMVEERRGLEEAEAEFERGMRFVSEGEFRAASRAFLKSGELADRLGKDELKASVRLNLGVLAQHDWELLRRIPLSGEVRTFFESPGGGRLVVLLESGLLQVFDSFSAEWVWERRFEEDLTALAYHPDGQSLVLATGEGRFIFLKREGVGYSVERKEVLRKRGNPGAISQVGFEIGGETLFERRDRTIDLWDVAKSRFSRAKLEGDFPVMELGFAEEANLVVGFSSKGWVSAWDALTGVLRVESFEIAGGAKRGRVNAAGDRFLVEAAGVDGTAIYEMGEPEAFGLVPEKEVVFTRRSGALLGLGDDQVLRFRDVESQSEVGRPLRLEERIGQFRLSEDESRLYTRAAGSHELVVWGPPFTWRNRLEAGQINRAGLVISTGSDGLPILWTQFGAMKRQADERLGRPLFRRIGRESFSPWADAIVAVPGGADCYLAEGKVLFRVLPGLERVLLSRDLDRKISKMVVDAGQTKLAMLADEKQGEEGCFLIVMDLVSGEIGEAIKLPFSEISKVSFASESSEALMLGVPGEGLHWINSGTGELLKSHRCALIDFDVDEAEDLVVVSLESKVLELFRGENWQKVSDGILLPGPARLVRLAGGGKYVVTSGGDSGAQIWEWASGSTVGPVLQNAGAIVVLEVNDGSSLIVTGGRDGEVRLWPIPEPDWRSLEEIGRALEEGGN